MKIYVQTTGDYNPSYTDASGWHVDDLGRLHITKTSQGNMATFHPGAWMFVERVEDASTDESHATSLKDKVAADAVWALRNQ